MSKAKKPTFRMANASTPIWAPTDGRSLAMFFPKLRGHRLQLHRLLHHGVVAVPLHEIGPSHERAVLTGSPVVVPQVEIDKIDGLRKRRPGEHAFLAQPIHQILGGVNPAIGGLYNLFGLAVDPVYHGRGMALRAHLLHLGLGSGIVWTLLANGVRQVVGQPLRWIVGDPQAVEAAHMTGGAGG